MVSHFVTERYKGEGGGQFCYTVLQGGLEGWKRCLFMNRNNYFLIKCWTIIKNILRTLQPQVGVNFKNIEPRLRFTGSYKKEECNLAEKGALAGMTSSMDMRVILYVINNTKKKIRRKKVSTFTLRFWKRSPTLIEEFPSRQPWSVYQFSKYRGMV